MATAAGDELATYLAPFGLTSFRPGQREVIEIVRAGTDCLCVMPTGGGKSLCYQLPALAGPGVTLVVSPLIALMKDQVDQLVARGLPATLINSTISYDEQSHRLERMAAGDYKLVYVVPERFRSTRFVEAARASDVRLLAIDEAHCVSEWGHDFRPDYARLGGFRARLGNPPTIALTATATDAVRRDIIDLLNLHEPRIVITGFARPNLHYGVQVCSTDRDKDEALFRFLDANPGSGIVYASTRKRCEALGEKIAARTSRRTSVYHAGMAPQERRAAQDDFMQGRTDIAVATLAFGMGIDKADVRFVVHYNLPGSLEGYYQEAGRAGRDGQPARCLLLFGSGDRKIHEFFIESAYPSREVVEQVYRFLCQLDQQPIEMTQQEVKEALGLQIAGEGVGACEKLLEGAGALERLETTDNSAAVRLNSDLPTLVDLLPQQAKVKRRVLQAVESRFGQPRHAWHYFQPRELLQALPEFDSTDLARHLRELATLDAVDYVPAFRGRAIHMRERNRPFDELAIDFEALEQHKAAEYARIEHLVRFARDYRCRQQQILHYFGETEAPTCGHCDNCDAASAGGRGGEVRPAGEGVLEAVRIVLSGVARISRTRHGCGKQMLAQMLCGSSSKGVVRNRLDKLSTFGLLGHLKQPLVLELIDALLICGLLKQTEIEPFRPVVQLTDRGAEVMAGRDAQPLRLALGKDLLQKLDPSSAAATSQATTGARDEPADLDVELVDKLKRWRDERRRAENVPAFRILTNALLEELARDRPQSSEALLNVKGMGPAKARQYGEQLLELLRRPAANHEQVSPPTACAPQLVQDEHAIANSPPPANDGPGGDREQRELLSAAQRPTESGQPSHYWTWRLLSAGFSPDECAAIRGCAPEVVLDHALRAAAGGLRIEAGWFLAADLVELIEREVGPETPARIRAILDRLPRGTRYEAVQLVLKSRQQAARPS